MNRSLLGDRYELRRKIGAGGMAEVWEATDHSLGRQVAVKLLHKHLAEDPVILGRFRSEAQSAARLTHPGIVAIYDTVTTETTDAIIMELVEGNDLRSILDDRRTINVDDAVEVGVQLAQALGHAHQNGIIHRDVKPANILVRPDRRVKLSDFGIAKALDDTTFTETGSLVGTVKYLAPEQIQGHPVDGRADLYALSTVLYEMVCGRVPFPAQDLAGAMSRVRTVAPRASTHRRNIPPGVDEFLARALAIQPSARPADASQWAAALEAVRRGDATTITRPTAPEPAAPPIVAPPEPVRPKSIPMRPAEPEPVAPIRTRKRSRLEVVWPVLALLLVVASVLTVYLLLRNPADSIADQLTTEGLTESDSDNGEFATVDSSTTTTPSDPVETAPAPTDNAETGGTTPATADTDGAEEAEAEPVEETTTTTTTAPEFVGGTRVRSFDPFGDDQVEHPEAVDRALDGNPDTFWYTQGYTTRNFGSIKPGVGYVIEFDPPREISSIRLLTNTIDWSMQVHVSSAVGEALEDWGEPIATFSELPNDPELEVPPTAVAAALLWITDLGEPQNLDEDSELIRLELFELEMN